MAEQDFFEFSAKFNVEVEKSSMSKACGVLDQFYNKYNNRKMKIDTSDMVKTAQNGISKIQTLYKQGIDEAQNGNISWWQIEDGLTDQFDTARAKIQDFFKDAKLILSDGSMFSALDENLSDVLSEKFAKGITVVAADLGERVQYLKDEIADVMQSLKDVGAVSDSYRGSTFRTGDMSENDIKNRINLLKQIISYQEELELFSGEKFDVGSAPIGTTTDHAKADLSSLTRTLSALKSYNDKVEDQYKLTTAQFEKRRKIINDLDLDMWDETDQGNAKSMLDDDDAYKSNIESLERYIQEKRNAIEQLKELQYELFRTEDSDDITEMLDGANQKATKYEGFLQELKSLKYGAGQNESPTSNLTGDLSEVVDALGRVEQAVNNVVDAFKPLTDALSSDDSAIGAMVKSSVADLEALNQKIDATYSNIETLSNKQFNMTNVISNGNNKSNDLDLIRQLRREAKDAYKQVEELYMESMETSKKIKGTPEGISAFLDFSNNMADFDMADLAKRIKSRSAASLGIVLDELNEWKKVLLQFNNLRNNVDAGSFNVSKYNDTSSKSKVGSKTTDQDEKSISETTNVDDNNILNQVKDLSTQVQEELTSIRSKIEETFNFSTISPELSNVQPIVDNIYQQFAELQTRIKALDFSVEIDPIVRESIDVKADQTKVSVDGEAGAAQDAGSAFSAAADAKRDFSAANREAAQTADQTVQGAKAEADAIEDVAKKAEQSAGKIVEANDKFDKIKYINDIDENGIPQPRSKVTIGTDKKENAYETISTFSEYDDESGKYVEKAVTVVKDFKKRAAELKKETAKIELAKKTVAKFLSQFNNKTAGHGSDVTGYDALENFKIENLDDIESAMQQMIDLDTKYNELTRDFRKGTKSMNPFVNAFNSMDEMRNKVKSAEIDFANLTNPTGPLRKQVEGLPGLLRDLNDALTPDDKGAINIENVAKAYGNLNEAIKNVNSSIAVQNKEQKTRGSQENEMWAVHNAEKEAAAEKERQIELAYSRKAAEEAAEEEKILAQSRKEANDFFAAEDAKELNALYKDRSEAITRIIQLNKKLDTLKTDKAKDRTRTELDDEKERLSVIDKEVNQYGRLIDRQKLQKQNDRLSRANVDIDVSKQQKQDVEAVNKALQRRKEIHEEIVKLQKQLDSTEGYQEQSVITKEIEALKARELAYTKLLASYKDNALQRLVTEQDNDFREKDAKNKRQKKIKDAADIDSAAVEAQKEDYEEVLSLVKQLHDAQTALHKINVDQSNNVHTAEREKEIARVKELSQLLKEVYGIDIKNLGSSLDKSSLLTQEQKNKLLQQEREYRQDIVDLTAKASDKAATKANKEAQNYGKTIFNREKRNRGVIDANISSFGDVGLSSNFLEKIEKYKAAYKELETLRNKFASDPSAAGDGALTSKFQESALTVEKLRKELMSTFKEYQKFADIPEASLLGEGTIDVDNLKDAKAAMIEFANKVTDGRFQFEGFNAAGTEMYGVINKGNGVLEQVTVAFNGATNGMKAFVSGSKQVTTSWSKLGSELGSGIKQIIGQYIGFHELWQAIRQGVGYVREIDLALTELRKVTNETDLTYKNFLKTMSQTGSSVGATVADLTSSAAD